MWRVDLHLLRAWTTFYPHAVGFASVLIWLQLIVLCLMAVDTICGALKSHVCPYPSYFSSENITGRIYAIGFLRVGQPGATGRRADRLEKRGAGAQVTHKNLDTE